MINLGNIPGGIIPELSDDLVEFVTNESANRYMIELDATFISSLNDTDNLDNVLTPEQNEYLTNLEKEAIATSTRIQTKTWIAKFRAFLEKHHYSVCFEKVPNTILNDYLRLFYSQLRTNKGEYYAPASLICVRAAIHRHLTSAECNNNINILTGDEFKRANGVLKAMVKLYLESNQDKDQHYECITKEDREKLNEYFKTNRENKEVLQQECLFNIIYYFLLRGRENLRSLTRQSIGFQNCDNREVAFIKVPLLQKNVKASLKSKEFEDLREARMASTMNDDHCPVKRLKYYISLLPQNTKDDTLFPRFNEKSKSFSSLQVLGKDKLGSLMSDLSTKAKLTRRYTNHCIRVTGINVLHDSGLPNEKIANISGHKDPNSVNRYIRKNKYDLIKASEMLAGAFEGGEMPTSSADVPRKVMVVSTKEQEIQQETCQPLSTKIVNLSGVYNNCTFNF